MQYSKFQQLASVIFKYNVQIFSNEGHFSYRIFESYCKEELSEIGDEVDK